jgi:hypothetical protein
MAHDSINISRPERCLQRNSVPEASLKHQPQPLADGFTGSRRNSAPLLCCLTGLYGHRSSNSRPMPGLEGRPRGRPAPAVPAGPPIARCRAAWRRSGRCATGARHGPAAGCPATLGVDVEDPSRADQQMVEVGLGTGDLKVVEQPIAAPAEPSEDPGGVPLASRPAAPVGDPPGGGLLPQSERDRSEEQDCDHGESRATAE